jgi:aspartate aminotransferase
MLRQEFSDRTRRVSASRTQRVMQEADRLRRQGVDVVDLGPGEPDFATPDHVKEAGKAALDQNFTKYTPNVGVLELREAICDRYSSDCGVTFGSNNVIVSAGGKQALFNVAMAILEPGDQVITHAPGWPTIVDQVKLAEASPVVVRTHADDGFRVRVDAVLESLTPQTRMIVINSPGNPTGGLISEEDLRTIAIAARARDIWIVVDLCYDQLIYDVTAHNLPAVLNEVLPERSVLVGSLSKTYAMTGWRCGWAVGPRSLISTCDNIQSHCTSGAASVSQHAGIAALSGSQACVRAMRDEYRTRRDVLVTWLSQEPRIKCSVPAGAFYLFPDISELLSPATVRTSLAFATRLLLRSHVAVTAGEAFDAPGFIRLSYAASLDQLREGVDRILEFIDALDRGEVSDESSGHESGS